MIAHRKFQLGLRIGLCLLLSILPVPNSAAPPGWLTTVHGVAVTRGGQPVPDLLLYISYRPGNDGYKDPTAATVVTDASGRFTLNYGSDHSVPPGSLLSCSALPINVHAWSLSYQTHHQPNDEALLFEQEMLDCERHWTGDGDSSVFTVVVPDTGYVSLAVRGPNGQLVRKHDVELVPNANQAGFSGVITYFGQTDPAGHLTIRRATGPAHLQVVVPGVGFGSPGIVNVLPGKTVTPPMPRLAPFGDISGRVAPSLVQTGAIVAIDQNYPNYVWHASLAVIAANGTFDLTDVLPGSRTLSVRGTHGDAKETVVAVVPGQEITGVSIESKAVSKPGPPQYVFLNRLGPPHAAHGRVTDTTGNPVAGATIYGIYTIPDGHGFASRKIFTTVTDDHGKYAVRDPDENDTVPWYTPLDVLASKPGLPPALVHAMGDPNDSHPPPADIPADLVLSNQHSRLTVRVLFKDAPAAHAAVRLRQEPVSPYSRFLGTPDATSAAVDNLLEPTAMTGADGTAVFEDLAPGLWQVDAIQRPDPLTIQNADQYFDAATDFPYFASSPEYPHTRRSGVAVQAGHSCTYSLDLVSWTRNVPFQSFTPEGTLLKGDSLQYLTGLAGEGYSLGLSARADETGTANVSIIAPGLWRVMAREHATPTRESSPDTEPFDEASAVIAAAPAVDEPRPVMLHTVTKGPGSIRVNLQDWHGEPLAGAVALTSNGSFGDIQGDGAVDTSGTAVFKNIPSGSYTLTPTVFGQKLLPVLGKDSDPLPSDALLIGHTVILPKTVTVTADTETDVVIQEQPVGYVRGRAFVRPSDPTMTFNIYGIYPLHLASATQINRFGEFVSGPYLPGKTSLIVQPLLTQGAVTVAEPQVLKPVTIVPGQIAHVEVAVPPALPFDQARANDEKSKRPLSGTIYLPDGKTPAWGARAKVFLPDAWEWRNMASADALGNLAYTWEYANRQIPQDPPPGNPAVPVVVAYLPGSYGAVIAPYTPGEPVRLTLPPAVSLHGRVTVGGQSVAGLDSTFTILAAYQGKGKINDLLSLETTAQADGTFDLEGLTPGIYQVQAARDGIWLSQTQTITVGQAALGDRTFNIGAPGMAMLLHVRAASGHPLIGKTVRLMRPAGPLTDALWPRTLTTDGAGDLRIEGLEAGEQSILINRSRSSRNANHEDQQSRSMISFLVPRYALGEQASEKTIIVTGE